MQNFWFNISQLSRFLHGSDSRNAPECIIWQAFSTNFLGVVNCEYCWHSSIWVVRLAIYGPSSAYTFVIRDEIMMVRFCGDVSEWACCCCCWVSDAIMCEYASVTAGRARWCGAMLVVCALCVCVSIVTRECGVADWSRPAAVMAVYPLLLNLFLDYLVPRPILRKAGAFPLWMDLPG